MNYDSTGADRMNGTTNNTKEETLQPYLSPLAVWALSVGSAIGWGSLVVTSRSYLSQAGPMGSILGLLIGFAMMIAVSSHYHFLATRYPGTGGLYNYACHPSGTHCLSPHTFPRKNGHRVDR